MCLTPCDLEVFEISRVMRMVLGHGQSTSGPMDETMSGVFGGPTLTAKLSSEEQNL